MNTDPLLSRAQTMRDALVAVRRDIHRHPELAFQEQRTAERGLTWLRGLGLDVQTNIAGTPGLIATLDTGRPGPTLLLRADMDALPITEETGAEYASETSGVMHACGHDAHVACVLGAASLLSEHRQALRGRLKFLLQPAEEKPPGGAKVLIEQGGILEGVDAALALHVYPPLPVGQMGFRPGVLLGYSDRFTVRIHGIGGHAARPHQTVDAVAVAVQVYQALQYLVSRENDPLHPFVITIGALQAGTAANVIPNEATLLGTVRSLDPVVNNSLPERLERVVAGICQATRARYTFEFVRGYPAMVNDAALTQRATESVKSLVGEQGVVYLPTPELGGEDFAFFSQRVPSLMFRLGVRNEARGLVHSVHSSRFDLDEDALPLGAAALARIAMDYLHHG
ncbi:MAG TPA: amidohydrolase [Alphaproteobacteria bacterium]|nr:amidohydrolase [Alphaproteobacteria bacterium]